MASEVKEDMNSESSDMKTEEAEDKSSADENNDVKQSSKDTKKEESDREESDEGSESEEEEVALFDRMIEVTGCRARKQVERLDVSFKSPKEKQPEEFPEGKGIKLGDCPKIEAQIKKTKIQDLKVLYKILFSRLSTSAFIKKNIRKFSGFPFDEDTSDYLKKKASLEKMFLPALKGVCSVLGLECSGPKERVVSRILNFLMCPEDLEKDKPEKKVRKKAASKKQSKKSVKKSKVGKRSSEDAENADDDRSLSDSMGGSDEELGLEEEISSEEDSPKSKKATPKSKPEKSDKVKKSEKKPKAVKRKRSKESEDSSEDEPIAKKSKMPSDDEISELVKSILDKADLQEITMKKVIKQVSDAYPEFDLSHKKAFIKETIKSVIS